MHLAKERTLKLEQAENKLLQAKLKVKSDSIDFEAEKINLGIAERQIGATQKLYDEGLKIIDTARREKSQNIKKPKPS